VGLFCLALLPIGVSLGRVGASEGEAIQVQEVAPNRGAAAVWEALLRLRTTRSVLHTTAHPDDEDAALLTWLARSEGVRTGLLTLNRGEGGANLIGPELYDALGILRTEEMLAANRFYGIDAQMFTRVTDFGFSKRLDETIEHWGREVALRDLVHAIRRYRPEIIVSRFHGAARDGHGNHQAAGLLSREAFDAAGDPAVFPDQLVGGMRPWQAKKLYLSLRGNEEATLRIDVGGFDPLQGRSWREIAMEGYGLHRSQSVGQARPTPGSATTSLRLVESKVGAVGPEQNLGEGLSGSLTDLARLAPALSLGEDLAQMGGAIEEAFRQFDARAPWKVTGHLVTARRHLRQAVERVTPASRNDDGAEQILFLLHHKEKELNHTVNLALGLSLEVLVEPERAVPAGGFMPRPRQTFGVTTPGESFTLSATVVCRGETQPSRGQLLLEAPTGWEIGSPSAEGPLPGRNLPQRHDFRVQVPDDAPPTRPYWSRDSELRDFVYRIDRPERLHEPFAEPELQGVYRYSIEGETFEYRQPARTSFVRAPYGEQRRLVTVAPALNVSMAPRVGVALPGATGRTEVTVTISHNRKEETTGQVRLSVPAGWRTEPASQPYTFRHEGETASFRFEVIRPTVAAGETYRIEAVAEHAGRSYREGYQMIAYPDLEPRPLYRAAVMEVRGIEVRVPANLHLGYVMGVGDLVPEALRQIGVRVSLLGAADLANSPLDGYDAIVVGIRASAVRPDLKAHNRRLLDYVEQGGNLIWQYQTPEFDEIPYGPFPYQMGRNPEEVSEEESVVTLLQPNHPLFTGPNRITAADFDGWVEERGSKWWREWDPRYVPLLECHDRGQEPQRGGMLQAEYGRGVFTYAGYAFYRQLPAGVGGAYRLFANLISLRPRVARPSSPSSPTPGRTRR
jgi:LmbE family N-acetylglucosaminyl deacetylase